MAVAVKNEKKAAQARSDNALALSSLLGAVYVIASLALLFYALPRIWTRAITPFFLAEGQAVSAVDRALLALALVAVAAGLAVLGKTLAGATQPVGMRAGVFLAVLGFLAVVLVVSLIGGMLQSTGRIDPQAGLIMVSVLDGGVACRRGVSLFPSCRCSEHWLRSRNRVGSVRPPTRGRKACAFAGPRSWDF